MKRLIIQISTFSKRLDQLIKLRKIKRIDFEQFERYLVENPNTGDVIPGLSGVRKIRFKGSYSGKRSSYRIDYLDVPSVSWLYLLVIYSKNEIVDLGSDERKLLKKLVEMLKEEAENG